MTELKLCPDCPAKAWIAEVIKQLKQKEIIKTNEKPSALKICIELRKIIKEWNLNPCPYYANEDIRNFLWQRKT